MILATLCGHISQLHVSRVILFMALKFKKHHMACHFSRVGVLENYSTANPLNSLCTVDLLKTLENSSNKALSRDVASYHGTYFHKGQIGQEIYSMLHCHCQK